MSETTDAYILAGVGAVKGIYEVFVKPEVKAHPELSTMVAFGAVMLLLDYKLRSQPDYAAQQPSIT